MKHSVVDLAEPYRLDFDYARIIADVVDAFPDGPIATVHIGGGARTLARYISTCRPESVHVVVEPNATVNELVDALPPEAATPNITLLETEGRDALARLTDATADLIIVDAFADCIVPASLTTLEAFMEMSRIIRPDGMVAISLLDTRELTYVHKVVDTAQRAFAAVEVIADKHVIGARGFGNIVMIAGRDSLVTQAIDHRSNVEIGAEHVLVESACPDLIAHLLTDAYPEESPNLGW